MPVFLIIVGLINDTTKRNSNDWLKRKDNHLVADHSWIETENTVNSGNTTEANTLVCAFLYLSLLFMAKMFTLARSQKNTQAIRFYKSNR